APEPFERTHLVHSVKLVAESDSLRAARPPLVGVMTLHKLAAGSGYTYLTRQVAMHDATESRQAGIASYYEEKGEAPGRWLGNGLPGLNLAEGDVVTEEQMKLLFGQGRHPRSHEPEAAARGWGALARAFMT